MILGESQTGVEKAEEELVPLLLLDLLGKGLLGATNDNSVGGLVLERVRCAATGARHLLNGL